MNTMNLKAVLTEEEEDLRREDSLTGMRRLLESQPERFRLQAETAAFPPRKRTDRRRRQPDALRAARSGPFPSRLPWELLPVPEPIRMRTRVVYRTLPAKDLTRLVRTDMKERRITMEEMAAFLHISPGTFRKWLRAPEDMTIRDYGALTAWLNKNPDREGRLPG